MKISFPVKNWLFAAVLAASVVFAFSCSMDASPAAGDAVSDSEARSITGKSGVMMQGFYWDVPAGGTWYNTMKSKAAGLANMAGGYGIDAIWFPPVSKADNGGYSMGYDPYDYYDVGQYNQKGSTETRFGSQAELKSAIATFKNYGIASMADIVLNHRSGGASESNPYTGGSTWTNFTGVASGKNKWTYKAFHPNGTHSADPGVFGGFADLCFSTGGGAAGYPYADMKAWMNWLKSTTNAGFSQWRFDYVKGIYPWVVKDMKAGTGGVFSVGEYWESNTSTLDWWANEANASAFDFALLYTMADICNNSSGGGYLPNLIDYSKSFAAKNPLRAVTFCGNHDTDPIVRDKMLAYAFSLTYQGYPMIWWKDYFDYGLATLGGQWGNGLKQLVWVRGKLGGAAPSIQNLKTNDGDCLIYGAYGKSTSSPGYIVVLNDNASSWKGSWVTTSNSYLKGKNLKCYAWYSPVSGQNYQPATKWCDSTGKVEVWAPPRGYAVYSVDGL
jgi:alpha-amylase